MTLNGQSVSGPRADADWSQATVKVTLPVHGTAATIPTEVELTLGQLAALLEAHRGQ